MYDCAICGELFQSLHEMRSHIAAHPPDPEYRSLPALDLFEGSSRTYRRVYTPPVPSVLHTLGLDHDRIVNVLSLEAATKHYAKCSLVLLVEFVKRGDDDQDIFINLPIRSQSFTITLEQIYAAQVATAQQQIEQTVDDFLQNGSGWVVNAVFRCDVEIAKCRPLTGSCGSGQLSIETSREVKSLKVLQRIDGVEVDGRCFLYAVARYFVGRDDLAEVKAFVERNFDTTGINIPVDVKQVAKFEELNSHLDMKINVLFKEGTSIYPLRVRRTEEVKTHHINLLLYQALLNGALVRHYVHINNLGKILRKEYEWNVKSVAKRMKYRRKTARSYQKLHVCPNCLAKFASTHTMEKHFELCRLNKELRVDVPQFGDCLSFKHWVNKFKVPLVGFYDFEAVQTVPESRCLTCTSATLCHHKASVEYVQEAGTFSIIIVNHLGTVVFSHTYSGDDAAAVFVSTLLDIEPQLAEQLAVLEPMKLTRAEEAQFREAYQCHICEKGFTELDERVRDHCHLTGVFLGAAHSTCNFKRQDLKKIPLFCHNFQGYDSHLIVKALRPDPRITKLSALPRNTEKFRTMDLNSYRFLDSMSFLNGSLASIVNDLVVSGHKFPLIDQELQLCGDSAKKSLLLKKGVYCYEFATSVEQLRSCKEIPPHENFYSMVSSSNVSKEDYEHAKTVFSAFGCQDMLNYTELYCRLDVLLLAECVLSFREDVYQEFGLDCCHYISLPQLAFSAMLKSTGVNIECLSDVDMILFLESAIRGGTSFIGLRHCDTAISSEGDSSSSSSSSSSSNGSSIGDGGDDGGGGLRQHLLYIDANNL